jgi:hypothetical protein
MESRQKRFCPGCIGRRLQASTEPCALCGKQWVRPRNLEHFWTRLTRWLLRPLGWFTHAVTIAVALGFLWTSTTHSTDDFGFLFYIIWPCLFLAVTWPGRALVRFIVAAFFRRGGWAYPGWRNWLVAPVAILLVTFLTRHDLPMRAAFFVSRPAMTRLAQRTLKLPPKAKLPTEVRVGRYRATNIRRLHGGVRFTVANNGFIDANYFGFAYFPKSKPVSEGNDWQGTHYKYLSGNWYSFREIIPF